jgi:MFS transporter, MHS family, proline/betaine transporter
MISKVNDQPLRREEKEAIGLLSIGTFLEYFDMMLYIHMAVLLNDLFFPKTDPKTASLLSAFAFCSTYVFRPFGALLFGYIGDTIGRKCSIVITTAIMAVSCFIMAVLPTYDQIGITASVAMICCRVLQSLAATGELMGAEIYITETLKPPKSYMVVSWITQTCLLGGSTALLIGIVVLKLHMSWRIVFLVGCIIALVGSSARRRLKETVEFSDFKRRMNNAINEANIDGLGKVASKLKRTNPVWKEKTDWRMSLAYFCIYSGGPLCFYVSYVYSAGILKRVFHFSAEQILMHNFKLQMLAWLGAAIPLTILCKYFKPLSLVKYRAIIALLLTPLVSFTAAGFSNNIYLFYVVQGLSVIFCLGQLPAAPILFKHFPILRRFTYSSLLYSLSRAVMYLITSMGLVYLVDFFGPFGIVMLSLPAAICFLWGVDYFEKLEAYNEQILSGKANYIFAEHAKI